MRKRKTDIELEYAKSSKIDYWPGGGSVAFVFSCPGRCEECKQMVCAVDTGTNMRALIKVLTSLKPETFTAEDPYSYTVTNASDMVHYQEKTNDSEPTYTGIAIEANLSRLRENLRSSKTIICMGKNALYAVNLIKKDLCNGAKIIPSCHLSLRSMNTNF